MTLVNNSGTYTFFRGKSQSIIDLSFSRGICNQLIQCWNIDEDGHRSDHLPTSTLWHNQKPTYYPTRGCARANWKEIYGHLQQIQLPPAPWDVQATLLAVTLLHQKIDNLTESFVPWSNRGTHRQPWWTPELKILCTEMWITARKARHPFALDSTMKEARTTARKRKKESRQAKWEYWEEKQQTTTDRQEWKTFTSLKGPTEKAAIGDIQGSTTFQGKCNSFKSILFPANGSTPEIPPPNDTQTPQEHH